MLYNTVIYIFEYIHNYIIRIKIICIRRIFIHISTLKVVFINPIGVCINNYNYNL